MAISHELLGLFLRHLRGLEIPLVLAMSLRLTACFNLRSFDPDFLLATSLKSHFLAATP